MQYTEEHLWLRLDEDDETVTVGISQYAADELGDIDFIGLPEVGSTVSKDDAVGVIESEKAAVDVLSPVDGEIVETNEPLVDQTAILSDDPETEGWLFRITLADPAQLDEFMSEAAYRKFIA